MAVAAPGTDRGGDAPPGGTRPGGPMGWHGDPWHRHQSRFFDGWQWTEHVADGGIAGVDSSPVADLPRSRPVPPVESPPDDPVGARVIDDDDDHGDHDHDHDHGHGHGDSDHQEAARAIGAAEDLLARSLLLLDEQPDADGACRLLLPDDRLAGRVIAPPPNLLTRVGRGIVSAPARTVSRLVVKDSAGAERLWLVRPGRRTAPVVDVTGPSGPVGSIIAERVRQGLRARVLSPSGDEAGVLERGEGSASLHVVGLGGSVRVRVTPVWDVPGARHHLPPGVVLVDRRSALGEGAPGSVATSDTQGVDLLLAAVLAPALLDPPDPGSER